MEFQFSCYKLTSNNNIPGTLAEAIAYKVSPTEYQSRDAAKAKQFLEREITKGKNKFVLVLENGLVPRGWEKDFTKQLSRASQDEVNHADFVVYISLNVLKMSQQDPETSPYNVLESILERPLREHEFLYYFNILKDTPNEPCFKEKVNTAVASLRTFLKTGGNQPKLFGAIEQELTAVHQDRESEIQQMQMLCKNKAQWASSLVLVQCPFLANSKVSIARLENSDHQDQVEQDRGISAIRETREGPSTASRRSCMDIAADCAIIESGSLAERDEPSLINEEQEMDDRCIFDTEHARTGGESIVVPEPGFPNPIVVTKQKPTKWELGHVNVISNNNLGVGNTTQKPQSNSNQANNKRGYTFRMKPVPPIWRTNSDLCDIKLELEAIMDYYENEEEVIMHFLLHNQQARLLKEISNTRNLDKFFEELRLNYGRTIEDIAEEFDETKQKSDETPVRFMARLQKLYRAVQGMQSEARLSAEAQIIVRRKFIQGIKSVEARKKLVTDKTIAFDNLTTVARDYALADAVGGQQYAEVNEALSRNAQALYDTQTSMQQALYDNKLSMQLLVNKVGATDKEPRMTNRINCPKCNGNHTEQECAAGPKSRTAFNKLQARIKVCEHCERKGHTIDECFQLQQCTFCDKNGHLENKCWKKYGRPDFSNVQGNDILKSPGQGSMGRRCFKCQQFGHFARDCRSSDQNGFAQVSAQLADIRLEMQVLKEGKEGLGHISANLTDFQ